MKVAFSHDWLNGMRGGEKCLEALCELYPASTIYTLFCEPGKVSGPIAQSRIVTSPLQRFPKVFTHYRHYLPFFPWAVEALDSNGCDLVISTSHCVAKGIKKSDSALHVCYCFTPMRYAWVFFDDYFGGKNGFSKRMIGFFMERLKKWDLESNEGIDHFVAISSHVKDRIRQFYKRDADVVYPPVDTEFYTPAADILQEDFYLIVSAMVPYKRLDLAIEAFNELGRKLVVIGDGPERKSLKRKAQKNIQFLGWQSDEILRDYYRRSRALIFPGEEDFGIVPVEVQACGRFVIAYGKGGALETVQDGETGVFFEEATAGSLQKAVERFEKERFLPENARKSALRFSRDRFKNEMQKLIERLLRRPPKSGGFLTMTSGDEVL